MTRAELALVDRLGFYIVYDTISAKPNTLRVASKVSACVKLSMNFEFHLLREVEVDGDARSLFTMAAYKVWEIYRTVIPLV